MKVFAKLSLIALLGSLTLLATACSQHQYSDAVKTAYIHKYGVPVNKEDWTTRGSHGQIITTRKDGVIVDSHYTSGYLEGSTTYTFAHSHTIAKEEFYKKGQLTSEINHYLSGVPKEKLEYVGNGHIITTRWYETGNPQFIEESRNSGLISAQYFTTNNDIEASIENGIGLRIQRDEYGELLCKDDITNGKLFLSTSYYNNGDPKELIYYHNDKIHGITKKYLMGGIPSIFEEWKNGIQQGVTTTFKNGVKYSEIPFHNGQKHGIEYCYREGNELIQEINWKFDKRSGQAKTYVEDFTSVQWYYDDKLVSKAEYDLNFRA